MFNPPEVGWILKYYNAPRGKEIKWLREKLKRIWRSFLAIKWGLKRKRNSRGIKEVSAVEQQVEPLVKRSENLSFISGSHKVTELLIGGPQECLHVCAWVPLEHPWKLWAHSLSCEAYQKSKGRAQRRMQGERRNLIAWSSGEILRSNSGEFYFLKVKEGSVDLWEWDVNTICILRLTFFYCLKQKKTNNFKVDP